MTPRRDDHPDELISASLGDDLTAAERARLGEHLATCQRCRETMTAFSEQRRLLAAVPRSAPPRELGARVRAAVESGAGRGVPWWRRPSTLVGAFASLATVVAGVLAVVLLSSIPRGEIGATRDPSPSATPASSVATPASVQPSSPETPAASPASQVALDPGQLGYLSLEGEPASPTRLSFVNDATGHAMELDPASGPPIAAAISPTGEWLAYIIRLPGPGVNQVWLLHLGDGQGQVLGCSLPHPFTERLVWSDDGRFLAFTLAEVNPGGGLDCGGVEGDGTQTNAWLFDAAATGERARLTDDGNAFAGDFLQALDIEGGYTLLVSHAAEEPYTEYLRIPPAGEPAEPQRVEGVFLPLISPNGDRALFWRGQMARHESGAWRFSLGGMPYVSGEPVDARPSWSGEPLFADLAPRGGDGFESGRMAWGEDSDLFAVWDGAWTGAPQGPDGSYPARGDVYVGRLSQGLLSADSRLPLELGELEQVVSVALDPSGVAATVTVERAVDGDLSVPEATLLHVPFDAGGPVEIGNGADAPPWNGPGVYGEAPVELEH